MLPVKLVRNLVKIRPNFLPLVMQFWRRRDLTKNEIIVATIAVGILTERGQLTPSLLELQSILSSRVHKLSRTSETPFVRSGRCSSAYFANTVS